jgi:hypothetical protein
MTVRVDDRWIYAGLPVVRLENAALAADVLPSAGGKILHLIDKAADRNVLWRHPRIVPHQAPIQANVDDHFSGGWDDAFPTGAPSRNRWGDVLPYLGEIWTLALSATVDAGPRRARVVLEGQTPITPARWTRVIELHGDDPILTLRTSIENVGYLPFDFNWGSHPALSVDPGFRIDVPASSGRVEDAGGRVLGEVGDTYAYPNVRADGDNPLDVRRVLAPETGAYALHVLEGLQEGWVAATDTRSKRGFGVVFDHHTHRAVWQWMVYGGFRGWYHVILEPWLAGSPALEDAVARGEARTLARGDVFETTMRGIIYSGVAGVAHLGEDGSVTGSVALE